MKLTLKDDELHDYGDYRTWPDGMRDELIDGVLPEIVIQWDALAECRPILVRPFAF